MHSVKMAQNGVNDCPTLLIENLNFFNIEVSNVFSYSAVLGN